MTPNAPCSCNCIWLRCVSQCVRASCQSIAACQGFAYLGLQTLVYAYVVQCCACLSPPISSKSKLLTIAYHSCLLHGATSTLLCNNFAGVSAEALKLVDSKAYIPMSGFVSSFNVSVAAALVFYEARRARLERLGYHGDLSDQEKQILTAVMLLRHQVISDPFA